MLLMVVVQQKLTKNLPMGRRPLAISHLVKRIRNQASERQMEQRLEKVESCREIPQAFFF